MDSFDAKLVELREQLVIDKDDLDTMLVKQPELYRMVGDGFAAAEAEKDKGKDSLEAEVAKLDARIRSVAVSDGVKLTEAQVAHAIKLEESYISVFEEYIRLKEISGQWKSLLESFSQRSYMLNHLVTLYCAGYWGQASGAGARQQAVTRVADDIRNVIDNERKRRRGVG